MHSPAESQDGRLARSESVLLLTGFVIVADVNVPPLYPKLRIHPSKWTYFE